MRKLKTIKDSWDEHTLDLKEGDEIEITPLESVTSWTSVYTYLITAVGNLRTRLLAYDFFEEEREVRSADLLRFHRNTQSGKYPQLRLKRRGRKKATGGQITDTVGFIRSSPDCSEAAEGRRTERREKRRKKKMEEEKKMNFWQRHASVRG